MLEAVPVEGDPYAAVAGFVAYLDPLTRRNPTVAGDSWIDTMREIARKQGLDEAIGALKIGLGLVAMSPTKRGEMARVALEQIELPAARNWLAGKLGTG